MYEANYYAQPMSQVVELPWSTFEQSNYEDLLPLSPSILLYPMTIVGTKWMTGKQDHLELVDNPKTCADSLRIGFFSSHKYLPPESALLLDKKIMSLPVKHLVVTKVMQRQSGIHRQSQKTYNYWRHQPCI